MINFKLGLLLILAVVFAVAQLPCATVGKSNPGERQGDEVVWEGIRAFYNYEFEKSAEVLTDARVEYPLHPTVHFVWAVSKWLKSQAYDGYQQSYVVLERSLKEVIPIYERLMEQHPEEPEYELYLAASHGLMARIALGKKDWLGVLTSGFKGYRGVLSVHKSHPELWDAYFPIGMLNFYVGNSSPIVRLFAKMLGLGAGRDVGLDQIRIAAEKGEFSWIEAQSTLAYIYLWMDDDYEASLPVTRNLRNHFPRGIYNQHLYTESLIRLGQLGEAEENLDLSDSMATDLPPMAQRGWLPTLKYQRALLNFYRGDLDAALQWVTASIVEFNTELDTMLGYGYLLRGQIYDLRGERKRAVTNYRAALALDNYTSAMAHAKRYLTTPYSP